MTANRYAIVVFWSEDDHAWVADVPDLKSCTAFGNSPEEAFAEGRTAMNAWLAAAREAGLEIPKPQFQPCELRLPGPRTAQFPGICAFAFA